MKRAGSTVLLLTLLAASLRAQERDTINPWNVAVASVLPAASLSGAIYENYADFWRNAERVPFYVSNDPPYSMHNDKLGHACFSAFSGDMIALSYRLAKVDTVTAAWLGGGLSFLTEAIVEVEDGFRGGSPAFGFSPGDITADFLGASIPVLRVYSPFVRALQYKTSFWPSEPLKAGAYSSILSDDESHFYWMSFDVHRILSTPAWLNLAIGYGVEHLDNVSAPAGWSNGARSSQIYFGPDFNFKALPIEGRAWEIISEILSHYKLPLPALQLYPRVKWWWLK